VCVLHPSRHWTSRKIAGSIAAIFLFVGSVKRTSNVEKTKRYGRNNWGLADRIKFLELDMIQLPDPPCIGCDWSAYCRIKAVACLNFKAYTNEGYRKIPGGKNEPWPRRGPKPNLKIGEAKDV